jgi:hypothetical protein
LIGIKIVKDWAEANAETVQKFAVFPTGYLGLTTPIKAWSYMMAISASRIVTAKN